MVKTRFKLRRFYRTALLVKLPQFPGQGMLCRSDFPETWLRTCPLPEKFWCAQWHFAFRGTRHLVRFSRKYFPPRVTLGRDPSTGPRDASPQRVSRRACDRCKREAAAAGLPPPEEPAIGRLRRGARPPSLPLSIPPSRCGPRLAAPVGLACGCCLRGARRESPSRRRGEPSAQAHGDGGGGGGWLRGGERAGATGSGSPPAHSHMLPSRSQPERRSLPQPPMTSSPARSR